MSWIGLLEYSLVGLKRWCSSTNKSWRTTRTVIARIIKRHMFREDGRELKNMVDREIESSYRGRQVRAAESIFVPISFLIAKYYVILFLNRPPSTSTQLQLELIYQTNISLSILGRPSTVNVKR
jgi:hypothetical protein